MANWEDELKNYISRKFEKIMGKSLPVEEITSFKIEMDVPMENLSIKDVGYLYAFSIMKEDFENAAKFKNELNKRDCIVELNIDERNKKGILDIYVKPIATISSIQIHLKVNPEGIQIDFDKADF